MIDVTQSSNSKASGDDSQKGFFLALTAYLLWGNFPLFFRALDHVHVAEMVVHRIIWSIPTAFIVLMLMGRTKDIVPTLKVPRKLTILFSCALMISLNWGLYIWAISVDRTVETALGYYINPLITVAMGVVLLGDRLDNLQKGAVALACLAVLLLTFIGGLFPWISLTLAATFAIYGYLRKTVEVGPTQGFFIEVLLLLIVAVPIIIWLVQTGNWSFGNDLKTSILLMMCGPITAAPLILYAAGAKRLRLSTIGIMQYIAPTIIFVISIFHFQEPFGFWQLVAFVMIWAALILYSLSIMRGHKRESGAG